MAKWFLKVPSCQKREGFGNIQVELSTYTILYYMTSKIPKVVRDKVLTQWLQGITRDKIAENNSIGEGTVSEIIKRYRENNSDIDQQRAFVMALKREGANLNLFASSIRLKRFTGKLGIEEEQLESLLVNLEEHSFKKGRQSKQFIEIVNEACDMANRMEVSVVELPRQIQQMVNESNLLAKEIKRKKAEKTMTLLDYNVTHRQLEEFRNNGTIVLGNKLQLAERQLAAERVAYSQGLTRLENELASERFAHELFASELENCNKKLYGNSKNPAQPQNRCVG